MSESGIQPNLETSQDKNPKVDGAFSDISHYCSVIDVAVDFWLQSAVSHSRISKDASLPFEMSEFIPHVFEALR